MKIMQLVLQLLFIATVCMPQWFVQLVVFNTVPSKNSKWPINLILHGHLDQANKICNS